MSADNGIIIRKLAKKVYEVNEYCASSGDETPLALFENLEEALKYGTSRNTEYGVSYIDPDIIKEKK
jgi:hypothetical protein